MTVHQISCSSSGTRSDQRALLASDQRAPDCSNSGAYSDVLCATMGMTIWTTMCKRGRKRTENQEHDHQQNSQHALFPVTLYHFHPPRAQIFFSIATDPSFYKLYSTI